MKKLGVLDWIMLVVSGAFLVGGIVVDVLAWLGLVAQDEPTIVLHLSTAAIIGTGLSGLVSFVAAVRAEQ